MLTGLSEQPLALATYLAGVAIIVLGGATFTFLVKGGTVAVLVRADLDAPAVEAPPLRVATVRRAAAFDLDRFTDGCRRLFRRYLALGLLLIALYGVIAVVYMFAVVTSYHAVVNRGSFVGWTLVASTISIALVLGVTIVNLLYLLTQIVVAAEDCGVRAAMSRVRRFLSHEHRRVAADLRRDARHRRAGYSRLDSRNGGARVHRLHSHRRPDGAAAATGCLARSGTDLPVSGPRRAEHVREAVPRNASGTARREPALAAIRGSS